MNIPKKLEIKETDFRHAVGSSQIDYDPNKNDENRKKHNYSLESAVCMQKYIFKNLAV
jgi:hypothetical protein